MDKEKDGYFFTKNGKRIFVPNKKSSDGAGGTHEATEAEKHELKRMGIIGSESKNEYDLPDESENINNFLGKEYKGYKGQAAIEKLLKEKQGHIKAAFYRDDMGDIDLVWGNEKAGLQHAIEQRLNEKNGDAHAQDMLENLDEAITKGVFIKRNDRGNFEFVHKKNGVKYLTIIAPEYNKNRITYILTAFRRGKSKDKK